MSALLNGVLVAVMLPLLLPVGVLLVQALVAALPVAPRRSSGTSRPRLAVLVPAHDEAAGIRATLASVQAQLDAGDRLLVVADNCSDDTAAIVREAGAEVVERFDAQRRGKGYALDFGVRHLAADPPELVVIVDADCELASGAIDTIARDAAVTGRPVQALYLMTAPPGASPMAAIAEFAQVVRNQVRPLGFHKLGLPCQLMGTGMAFPWALIRELPLASGHIVEDMQMGADCARAGRPPLFCPDARVTSRFPLSREGARSQRTRWEHGHLAMIAAEVPRLLRDAMAGRGRGLFSLALDMCVPPLALLGLLVAASCVLGAVLYALGLPGPLGVALFAASAMALAVGVSWLVFGRDTVPFARLALAPFYMLGKLPMYARFLGRRQVEWVRSRRDESHEARHVD